MLYFLSGLAVGTGMTGSVGEGVYSPYLRIIMDDK
jgi:hypothetical protein